MENSSAGPICPKSAISFDESSIPVDSSTLIILPPSLSLRLFPSLSIHLLAPLPLPLPASLYLHLPKLLRVSHCHHDSNTHYVNHDSSSCCTLIGCVRACVRARARARALARAGAGARVCGMVYFSLKTVTKIEYKTLVIVA